MEELDLKEILMLFWNKKVKIALIVAIFLLIGIIYTIGFVTPVYTSKTTLVLAKSDSTTSTDTITASDITLNSNLVSTYSELVKSKSVRRQVISNLGIDLDEEDLKQNIVVSSVSNTELIEIAFSDVNPTTASKVTNEIAKVFTGKVKEIYNIDNVQVVDEAEVEDEPSNINHTKDVIMFTFIGIVVAIGYVLVVNMLDTTIKSAEEVERQFKVPVLASIPLYNFEPVKGGKKR